MLLRTDEQIDGGLMVLRGIKAVFLDFGGTIAFDECSYIEGVTRLCRNRGHDFTIDQLREASMKAESALPPRPREIDSYHPWNRKRRLLQFKGLGLDENAANSLVDKVESELRLYTRPYLFPETEAVFTTLKANDHKVGIISNISPDLPTYLRWLGADRWLDFAVASGAIGISKPDPGIFREALRLAGVSPEEAVHVGDSLEADVMGAQSVGINPILVDRKGFYSDPDCICVNNLTLILEILGLDIPEFRI